MVLLPKYTWGCHEEFWGVLNKMKMPFSSGILKKFLKIDFWIRRIRQDSSKMLQKLKKNLVLLYAIARHHWSHNIISKCVVQMYFRVSIGIIHLIYDIDTFARYFNLWIRRILVKFLNSSKIIFEYEEFAFFSGMLQNSSWHPPPPLSSILVTND